jgi:predicted DsbA family dithiol-disulfide isomerase
MSLGSCEKVQGARRTVSANRRGTTGLDVAIWLLVVCAVILTGVAVSRSLQPNTPPPISLRKPAEQLSNWDEIRAVGHRFESTEGPVQVVVFSDFECPACARFAKTLYPGLKETFGDTVSLTFRHWPLPNHKLAYRLAVASDCAGAQNRFVGFHDVVFSQQDSLPFVDVSSIALKAGVPDLPSFDACARRSGATDNIERDIEAAMNFMATGTPAVIVDGWYLPGGVNAARLDSAVRGALDRKSARLSR